MLCGEKSITVTFFNGTTELNTATLYFAADTTDWQFASACAVAGGAYTKIEIFVRFCQSRNAAYFDGIQLYREEFSQAYEYDNDDAASNHIGTGNFTGYTSLIGQNTVFDYDSGNNLTSATDPRGNTTYYTYDSHHNLLTTTVKEKHSDNTETTLLVTSNTYDTNGNVTQTQVGTGNDYIRSSTTYDSASALATAVTDARGYSVTYGYDSTTRQQTTVTDPKGNTSTYSYGNAVSMLRLASLTSPLGTDDNPSSATVQYGYDSYGKLTGISRGNTVYNFTYDQWGNVVDTKVGNTTLSTNVYDQYGRLESVIYGNGFVTEYVYDSLDRTKEIWQGTANNTALTYKFVYNGEGDLYELRNYDTGRSTFFEYDHAGRCMASTEKSFEVNTDDTITYLDTISGYRYEYDPNNNLAKLTCTVLGSSWNTTYSYDGANRPLTATLANNAAVTNAYDSIGRISSRTLLIGNTSIPTNITYAPGADGSQTALTATYTNGTDNAYNYAYDANGNIIQIWRGSTDFANASEKYSYEYDKANQLIRENLYYGTNSGNNGTFIYAYDQWGNIQSKTKYAYAEDDNLGNALNTKSYTYASGNWGDILTGYDGKLIMYYDAMGNPGSYMGADLTWEGKQLTRYSKIEYGIGGRSTVVSYDYDQNGLRTQKTVNGTTTSYYYNGSVLIGMQIGEGATSKVLKFSYDASGNAVAVDYSTDGGANFNTYYYLRNAQNDIVKIIDSTGSAVVEYVYDSWGKIVASTGTLETTLGRQQPFRYRGYVYDTETGFYYLQSRYYDPSTCRFISADVLLSTGQGVIGHNSFAYCLNDPVDLLDESGLLPICIGPLRMLRGWGIRIWDWWKRPDFRNKNLIERIKKPIYNSWRDAENALRKMINSVEQQRERTFNTPYGRRIVDAYNPQVKLIAEAKYGYASLSSQIQKEIAKDKWLLDNEIVNKVEWHFFISKVTGKGGLSKSLRKALEEAGIKIVEHY